MRQIPLALVCLIGVPMLAGCATSYDLGRRAFQQKRYEEAVRYFRDSISAHPDRPAALVGLGVSQYKLQAFDEAVATFSRAVARDPTRTDARLYLGLSYLQQGEDRRAEDQLAALLRLKLEPRVAAEVGRALSVLRASPPSNEVRSLLAGSLDDEAEWAQDLRDLARTLQWYYPRGYTPRCTYLTD